MFFDILGLYLVSYARSLGSALNWAAGAAGLWLSREGVVGGTSRGTSPSSLRQALLALLAPTACNVVVGVLLNVLSPISWYSDAKLAFGE